MQHKVMNPYRERHYRQRVRTDRLTGFRVVVQETDLMVYADQSLAAETRDAVVQCRSILEGYLAGHPEWLTSLVPVGHSGPAPDLIREMAAAAQSAGVGPMAAVAGAIAEKVGRRLLRRAREVIVENGGDTFVCCRSPVTMAIFAGRSPLSMRVGLKLPPSPQPLAVCTSSGTVGHSLSHGRADAACVLADSCALADAAATAIGNRVAAPGDIAAAIDFGRTIAGVDGVVVISGGQMGLWGRLEVVPLGKMG
jgi:ApbE superfamily uncharacterized protein (UPF0280 family)